MGTCCSTPDNNSKASVVVPYVLAPSKLPPFTKSSLNYTLQSQRLSLPNTDSAKSDGIMVKYDGIVAKSDGIVTNPDGIMAKYDEKMAKYDGIMTKYDGNVTKSDVNRSPLVLYGHESCPFTSRIRICLQHKHIPVQVLWLNAHSDEKGRSKQLLAYMLPADGKLPILQHEDHTISGSSDDILDYVEARFPNPSLLGNSNCKGLREWVTIIRDTISPLMIKAVYNGDNLSHQDVFNQLDAAFCKLDSAIAKFASKGPYFYGDQFTLVDVYLIPFLLLRHPLEYFHGIEIRSEYSHLRSYSTRMTSFSSYAPVRMDLEILHTSVSNALTRSICSPLILASLLQHKSILNHLQKLLNTVEELVIASKQPSRIIDPVKGSLSMQIKKLSARYVKLLEFMLEHAQMEERVIFPALERADRGLTKAANESHARDLPVMNGIKEDFKSVVSLEHGSPGILEALQTVATRLRALQVHTAVHFHEEEKDLFPLLNAAGIGKLQQTSLLGDCMNIMESMHTHMLPFMLSGLHPHQIHQYLTLLHKSHEDDKNTTLIPLKRRMIILKQASDSGDGESAFVWTVVQERLPALASLARQAT